MKVKLGMIDVNDIEVTLADGRIVKIRPDGEVSVWAAHYPASGYSSNQYRLTLPTFDDVSAWCPANADGHGQVPWTVTHVH